MATVDSGVYDRTALAALNAIARQASDGDIGNAEAVALLRRLRQGLRACIIYDTPVVRINEADLAAAIGAPPEKEEADG